jgi:hypothetical protein
VHPAEPRRAGLRKTTETPARPPVLSVPPRASAPGGRAIPTPPKHRLQPPVRRMVDMVDARTGMVHLLTPDAAAAVCGADVVPASLTELEQRYCWPCRSTTTGIPSQRSRSAARR